MKKILFILSIIFCAVASKAQSVYPLAGNDRDTGLFKGSVRIDKRIKAPYYKAASGDTMVICADAAGNFFAIPIDQVRTGVPGGGGGTTYFAGYAIKIEGDSIKLDTATAKTYFVRGVDSNIRYATPYQLSTGLAGKSNVGHTHAISDVTGLPAALNSKLEVEADPYFIAERGKYLRKDEDSLGTSRGHVKIKKDQYSTYVALDSGIYTDYNYYRVDGIEASVRLYGPSNLIIARPADTASNSTAGKRLLTIQGDARVSGSNTATTRLVLVYAGSGTNKDGYFEFSVGAGTTIPVVGTWGPNGLRPVSISVGSDDYNSPSTLAEATLEVSGSTVGLPKVLVKEQPNQTANNIEVKNSAGTVRFKVKPNGAVSSPCYIEPGTVEINADYTVRDSDAHIYVNTPDSNINVYLDPSKLVANTRRRIKKRTNNENLLTIIPVGCNIDGDGPLVVSDKREIEIFFDGSNFETDNLTIAQDIDHIHGFDFGMTGDGQRAVFNTKAGNDTVTSPNAHFTTADIGKKIVIHEVLNQALYSDTPKAITTTITQYVNDSTIVVQTAPDYNRTGKNGYWGTDNCNPLINALAFGKPRHIGEVQVNGEGLYLFFPQESSIIQTQAADKQGIIIDYPVTIRGAGSNTKFKWCVEDNNPVDSADRYNSSMFILKTNGDVALRDFQALSADQYSSEVFAGGDFVHQANDTIYTGSFYSNVDVIGDSLGGYYDWPYQWGQGYYFSTHAAPGKYNINIEGRLMVAKQGVVVYSDDSTSKVLTMENIRGYGGGTPKLAKLWGDHANITAGDSVITITGIPGFSFKDFRSQYIDEDRKPQVVITNGTTSFTARVKTIVTPTSAILDSIAPVTYTNATITRIGRGTEGHFVYDHPNVTPKFRRVTVTNCNGFVYHPYTGGGVTGTQEFPGEFIECADYIRNPEYPVVCRGWMVSKDQNLKTLIKNCDSFTLNEYNYQPRVYAYNTNFKGTETVLQGPGEIWNCTAQNIYSYTDNDSVKVFGGRYKYVGVHPSLNSWISVDNATVGYFASNANVRLTNCSDTTGHPINTNLSTGATTDYPLAWNTTNKQTVKLSPGSFITPSVLHDSLVAKVDSVKKSNDTFYYYKGGVKYFAGLDATGAGGSGITTLNSQTGTTQSFATGTAGTDFGISSSGDVHTFNIPTASATNRGLLSNTDWSTFNGKQASLGFTPKRETDSTLTDPTDYVTQYQRDTMSIALWNALNGKQAAGSYLTSANIEDALNNGTTDKAPSENAVYDALALKQDAIGYTPENTANKATSFGTINNTLFPTVQACSTYVAGLGYITTSSVAAGYQPLDADLTAFAGLTPTNDDIVQRKAGAWVNRTMAQLKTDLALAKGDVGLGNVDNTSDATKNSASATLTNKTINGSNNTITNVSLTTGVTGVLPGTNGGTGVNNGSKTITVSGNVSIGSSTNTVSFATSGNTSVTLPTSGTLATTAFTREMTIAISDESTAITTGTAKVTFRMPFACTVTAVRASVNTVSSSGTPTFDINEGGTSILGTKLSIDANEKTSTTAASAATITDSSIADDAEMTIDVDTAGTGAKGAKIIIYYNL